MLQYGSGSPGRTRTAEGPQMDDDGVFNILHRLRLRGAAHAQLCEGRAIRMEGPIVIWLDNDRHLEGESLGIHVGPR